MTNKALRILIADQEHFHRMKIERWLNRLDYYRVAPVHNVCELLTLVDYGCQTFDVVVVNATFTQGALELSNYLTDCPHVRHALIYNDPTVPLPLRAFDAQVKVNRIQAALPDGHEIARLMAHVEAPSAQIADESLHWPRHSRA
jgi:hypothetical protein